jgi:hypothetical protein
MLLKAADATRAGDSLSFSQGMLLVKIVTNDA